MTDATKSDELEQPLLGEEKDKDQEIPTSEALTKVSNIAKNIIIGALFHPMYSIVNALVLGHRETPEPLAGLGLGSLTVGVMGLSIGSSFAGGVGTFISQSYGQGDLRLCAVYRNRQIYLSTILYIILFIPTIWIESIYEKLGQDPEVAAYGAQYVHTIFPFVYLYFISQTFASYSQNQRVTHYGRNSMITGTLFHACMIGLFVFYFDWGFTGVVWATALMFVARCAMNVGQVVFLDDIKKHDDVHLFSWETIGNIGPLVCIDFQQLAMSVWGWWAFDIFTLMATYLGGTVAAAQTIMRSIGLLTFMIPAGFAIACGILVGNSVGEKKPKLAMQFYRVSGTCCLVITILQIIGMYFAETGFHKIFTEQESVQAQLARAWPVLLLFMFFDTTQAVAASVVKACGKQGIAALATSTSYFLCGIPLSYYCAFKTDFGIQGIWFGPTFAVAFMTFLYNSIIGCIDWPTLIAQIVKRRADEKERIEKLKAEKQVAEKSNEE